MGFFSDGLPFLSRGQLKNKDVLKEVILKQQFLKKPLCDISFDRRTLNCLHAFFNPTLPFLTASIACYILSSIHLCRVFFLMVRWVVGSILHGVDPLSYFSFQPVLHNWCNKGRGMCYPVCGMVHIKEPLLLIDKSSLCGGSGFPFSLSEWSLTICLTPYNRR